MRLTRHLAQAGIASRRQADALVQAGKVLVNGKIITEPWYEVAETDKIKVEGKGVVEKAVTMVYLLNKPKGVVCSTVKQGTAKIITELLPPHPKVVPVGRLDKESEGLIILTNDGELANKLLHPSYAHEREYQVTCKPQDGYKLTEEQLVAKLIAGVKLGDGKAHAVKAQVRTLPEGGISLRIVVVEGRQHLVRRMCAVLKLDVKKLRRIRIGSLELHGLSLGSFKVLGKQDLSFLRSSVRKAAPKKVAVTEEGNEAS